MFNLIMHTDLKFLFSDSVRMCSDKKLFERSTAIASFIIRVSNCHVSA